MYNDMNSGTHPAIQLVLDFTEDVAERFAIDEAQRKTRRKGPRAKPHNGFVREPIGLRRQGRVDSNGPHGPSAGKYRGFVWQNCRVDVGFLGRTRHRSALWNHTHRCQMSGMSVFYSTRAVRNSGWNRRIARSRPFLDSAGALLVVNSAGSI